MSKRRHRRFKNNLSKVTSLEVAESGSKPRESGSRAARSSILRDAALLKTSTLAACYNNLGVFENPEA